MPGFAVGFCFDGDLCSAYVGGVIAGRVLMVIRLACDAGYEGIFRLESIGCEPLVL